MHQFYILFIFNSFELYVLWNHSWSMCWILASETSFISFTYINLLLFRQKISLSFLLRFMHLWEYLVFASPSFNYHEWAFCHCILQFSLNSSIIFDVISLLITNSSSNKTEFSPNNSNWFSFSFASKIHPSIFWLCFLCKCLRLSLILFNFSFNTNIPQPYIFM